MANFFPAALLLLLLFFFNPSPLEAATDSAIITSIDCGASQPHTDELGIQWTPDSSLIKTGLTQTVPNATSIPQYMQTLRVFPTGKRNCYALSIPGGASTQVLVRATFYYGNYDGKNSPPTFDLELDGSSWSTVETAVDKVVSEEGIFEARGGSTSVCVVQRNEGELPFVSAIELRRLGDDMYSRYDRSSSALVLALRTAAGVSAQLRYPDDPYDRIWFPIDASDGLNVVQNQANTIDTGIKDAPPAAIFQSAVTPAAGSNTIGFTAPLPSNNVSAYFNLYFTEVTQLAAGDNRTFQVFVDGNAESDPFAPPFGSIIEIYMANISASSTTQISLQSTTGATLPPVISAIEAYVIIPLSGGGRGGGSAAPAPGNGDARPSAAPQASDVGSPTPSDSSSLPASDQTNSPPTAQRVPAGFAFGGGRKGSPSFGNKVEVGRALVIGIGILLPILFLNFV
ncbi:hypothetical protein KFK09_021492 [Dendrobium nobile]|uniref:Ig-like domain-containing protein n=1 Tax=Dendrobium nobile TaxID=94219 RepID=A0A8T3AQ90_DENNO|nr:hypothetical protein KFK09_021492 [Dendrobium nobile]